MFPKGLRLVLVTKCIDLNAPSGGRRIFWRLGLARTLNLGNQRGAICVSFVLRGSSKPRRVSKVFKHAVSRETARAPSIRNAQQFLSARRIIAGGARAKLARKGSGLQSASGKSFCVDNMKSYLRTAKAELCSTNHVYVGLDGTTVVGKDVEFLVLEATDLGRACWLPPKVPNSRCKGGTG